MSPVAQELLQLAQPLPVSHVMRLFRPLASGPHVVLCPAAHSRDKVQNPNPDLNVPGAPGQAGALLLCSWCPYPVWPVEWGLGEGWIHFLCHRN